MDERESLLAGVCDAFREITGGDADPKRDGAFIFPLARDHGWKIYDFRQIIDYHWQDSKEREYLEQPGNCHLRAIFNPRRHERLKDVLSDLRRKQRALEDSKTSSDVAIGEFKANAIVCRSCGQEYKVRYLKVKSDDPRLKWRWKSYVAHDTQDHMKTCFPVMVARWEAEREARHQCLKEARLV